MASDQVNEIKHQASFRIPTDRIIEFCDWLDQMVPAWEPPMFYRTQRLFKTHLERLMAPFYNTRTGINRSITIFNLTTNELVLAKLTWDVVNHD